MKSGYNSISGLVQNLTRLNKPIGLFKILAFICLMSDNKNLLFKKGNYTIMLTGIALILTGFVVMTMETAEYGFGSLGLTVGPTFIMVGFLVEIYAILYKEKVKS